MADITVTIHDHFTSALVNRLVLEKPRMEHALANEVMKDTTPFVPALTLSLVNRTQVSGNTIVYPGPYARYLYYGKVMVDAATGLPAFRIVGKDGSEIFRFRKGAKLKPIDKPLKYSKVPHPQATDHWLESSKQKNLKKWEHAAKEMIERALNNR